MDLAQLPRQLTWPGGFALVLLLSTLALAPFRRRSTLLSALFSQVLTGTVFMAFVLGLIYLSLPPWDKLPRPGH